MYKLTYESDEDLPIERGHGGDADELSKERNKASLGNDKFDQSRWTSFPKHRQSDNMVGKERSETLNSTAKAAVSVKSKETKSDNTTDATKKFYSLFNNDSCNNCPAKEKRSAGFSSGCKFLLLVLYLLIITAGIVVLFVYLRRVSEDNQTLRHRVSFLEASVNYYASTGSAGEGSPFIFPVGSGGASHQSNGGSGNSNYLHPPPPPPRPDETSLSNNEFSEAGETHPPPPLPAEENLIPPLPPSDLENQGSTGSMACCLSFGRILSDLSRRLSSTSSILGDFQKMTNSRFTKSDRRLLRLQESLKKLEVKLNSNIDADAKMELQVLHAMEKIERANGLSTEALQLSRSEEKNQHRMKHKAIAFSAHRLADTVLMDVHGQQEAELAKLNVHSKEPNTFIYSHEMINKKDDLMNPSTGIFMVPEGGIYVFHVSFCTVKNADNPVAVALKRNDAILRNFHVPIIGDDSESFTFNFQFPPVPFDTSKVRSGRAENPEVNAYQHHYTEVVNLHKGDNVKLQLLAGSIVELSPRNGMENQSCTSFSGYKI